MIDLTKVDLVVGEIYPGGPTLADEPLSKLMGVGNMGGIRTKNAKSAKSPAFVVLFSTGAEEEWPDGLDLQTAQFVYFGDNRKPGQDLLHSDGNKLFHRLSLENLETKESRDAFPPFFVFTGVPDGPPRAVKFAGVAVPSSRPTTTDWCVAKYFGSAHKFSNFELRLDVLADGSIPRQWIDDRLEGVSGSTATPRWFRHWVETGESIVAVSASTLATTK